MRARERAVDLSQLLSRRHKEGTAPTAMAVGAVPSLCRRERSWLRSTALSLALMSTVLGGSCVRYVRTESAGPSTGTCQGACQHYLSCKGDVAPASRSRCLSECKQIYV